jgi:hypothetical protein
MELTGTLDCFPLRELLELMQDSSMCGVVEITGSRGTGCVGARDGLICHAEYAGKLGHAALWLLFEETNASFKVSADASRVTRQTLIGDASMLSDEGEERARLWRPIRQRIPDLELIPVIHPNARTNAVLEHLDSTVFAGVDNTRTIEELAVAVCLEVIDVCRSLIRLVDAGVVGLTMPHTMVAAQAVVSAQYMLSPESDVAPEALKRQPVTNSKDATGGLFRRPLGAEPAVAAAPTGLLGRLLQSQK